jgi:DNA-binding XRE family transcriptional regulator
LEKLAINGISPDDFEQIVMNPDGQAISRTSGRLIAFGRDRSGDEIACVYELDDDAITVYPITGYFTETDMLPFKLTQSQRQQVAKAKAAGQQRLVLRLSESQRQLDSEFVAEIDELIREELGQSVEPSDLARQLRVARKAAGMSLADVAEQASMTRQAVLAIESGKNSNPKIDTLNRIADALGLKLTLTLSKAT